MDMRLTLAPDRPRATSIIELGDLSVPEIIAPQEPVPPRVRRALRVLAVVVLLFFVPAGAGIGAPSFGDPLWTRQASLAGLAILGTTVVMSDAGTTGLVGRDIETGDPRWRIGLTDPPQYTIPVATDIAATVVRDVSVDPEDQLDDPTVTLVVTPSGVILTRLPGNLVMVTRTSSLLLVATGQASVSVDCPADAEICTDMAGFDTSTERRVWQRAIPGVPIPVATPGGAPTRFATIQPNGLVDIRDPATGDAVGSLRLPKDLFGGSTPQLLQVGDTLVSAVRKEDRAEVNAYALGPRGHQWGAALPVSRTVSDSTARFYLSPGCGQVVCLHADGADALFDLGTGASRGQIGYQVIGQVGDTLLAVPSFEQRGTPESRRVVYLINAANGQSLGTQPKTVVVPWPSPDGRALLAREGAAGTEFSVLDGRGGIDRLGTVSGVDLTCAASVAVLICADPVGFLRVWRLPLPKRVGSAAFD